MADRRIWFRWNSRNSYSIAALLPLIDAELTRVPKPGIMLYSFATPQAEEIYNEVSRAKVDAVFVAGGPHPSVVSEEVLEHFDFVVVGEGEETLPELVETIAKDRDPGNVRGIAFKTGGRVRYTERRPDVDLDLYPAFERPILAPVEISRGCPWGCTYCQTPQLFGCKMRHRSITAIKKYAKMHKDIRFTSPNSMAYGSDGRIPRLEKVEALLKALAELKRPIYFGTFPSEVRPDFISDGALELVTTYCANRTISLGGQSGSERVLEAVRRGHGVEEIERACEIILEHGLMPQVDLIFGLPMESEEDQHKTVNLARWIVGKGGKVRAHRFSPLPGTLLAGSEPTPLAQEVEAQLGRLALQGKLKGTWAARQWFARDKTA